MKHTQQHASRTTLFAGIIGNTLEWYDFLLYAYFAPILAPLFFPAKTPLISLLLTFGVFALGFLIRPLGAIVIGQWGDRYGRRKALLISISLMTIPTVAMGFLPTYASIGIAAPILLTLIRFIQGFAVSGEIASAACYLVEHANKNRRGYAGSLIMSSAILGILLGASIATLQTELMPEAILHSWGWRIPFLLAGVFGILGIWIRLRATESPQFIALPETAKTPLKTLLLHYPKYLLQGIGLTMILAIGNYYFVAYFTTYLVQSAKLELSQAMLINVIAMVFFIIFAPLFGLLSDKFGRKRLFLIGAGLMIIGAPLVFYLLLQKNFLACLSAEIIFAIILAATDGLILTTLAELFPTNIRATGASLCYNTSLALFGGTAPLVAITLTQVTQNAFIPAWYVMFGALISFLCACFFKPAREDKV